MLDRDSAGASAAAADIPNAIGIHFDVYCDADSVQAAATKNSSIAGAVHRTRQQTPAALYADALMHVKVDKWNQLLAVNLTGYLICAQVFGRHMIEAGGGSMVHVASISGRIPQPFSGAYSVSKAGGEKCSPNCSLSNWVSTISAATS